MLKKFDTKKTLIVVPESNEIVYKSVRNIEGAHVLPVNDRTVVIAAVSVVLPWST